SDLQELSDVMARNARTKKELKTKIKRKNAAADDFIAEEDRSKQATALETINNDNVVKFKLRKHFHEKRNQ
ncbi:MAG: Integrase catalytic protein, partial [Cyanobacteriota bacterium erpe_2018_sw_21hr_WHONDRS-SW48-000092_B_bin.40]|nr:Integrase catalytic protein [Cyanobacteriota bacterium erpe_2018_sw_21hr_WHONDRS-SW48-000092_B_bin.40]